MALLHQLFLDSLRATQWYDADKLLSFQLPQIERMCRHAASATSAYAERLRPLFRFGDSQSGKFRFERWRDIPILTRRDLATNIDAFTASSTPEATGAVRTGTTSGSTGTPLAYRASTLMDIASICQNERVYEEHDFDLFPPFASIRLDPEAIYPEGKRRKGWSRSAPSGELGVLNLHTPVEQQLAWLKEFKPTHLHVYPSVLEPLIEANAIDEPLRFERVMTFSEVLSPETRRAAEAAFDCKVVDCYGCNEGGFIAWQCPVHETVMHIAAESNFVELLDEQGEPVAQGELGRVVLTSLHNFAMPLIRYDVGDLAAFGPPCSCGRGLPALSRIAGRTHSVFILPGGRRLVPDARDLAFFEFIPMRQFQFVQHTLNDFELRYVPAHDGRETDPAGLLAHLRRRPKTTESPLLPRRGISARGIPARAITF
jgi:phenylacetate-CoA ligase